MRDLFSTLGGALSRKPQLQRVRNDAPVPYSSATSTRSLFSEDNDLPNAERAYEAYGSVGTLFAIVKQIYEAFGSTEWHLYRKTSVRDKNRRQEVLTHGFLDVWNMPNPFMTGRMFRETCQQHLDLVGETYFVLIKTGSIIYEMWPVRPDRMIPVKHPTKYLTGWIYRAPDGQEVPLDLDQVVQIKYPNPSDIYRGMGPVCSIQTDVDAARFAAEWNRNFFINGAQPGGVIKVPYKMGDTEWKTFMERWNATHQGVANAHHVAILENADWVDTKFSMEDMQFSELRNLPRELIREAFAFPKPMLGTVDDVNRANADAGKEIMAENQTAPRLARWKDIINVFLLPQFANGKALELDYDNPVPVSTDQANATLTASAQAAQMLATTGWHPDDVTDACRLPHMRWVGPAAPSEGGNEEPQEMPKNTGGILNGHKIETNGHSHSYV
jgi:HK97 family phage portal protein